VADTDFTHRESTAWVSGTATVLPTYPADVSNGTTAADDVVYMTVVAKPDTTTITPSGSWTLVEELTGGSGAVAADTGPTKTGVWKRSVPIGGLTSTTTVTLTGASVAMACMSSYRPVVPGATTWTEDCVGASKAASADLALTASAAPTVAVANNRHVAVIVAAPTDASTTQPVATVAASGATVATPVVAPGSDFTGTGNDLAASRYDAEVTAGTSASAPSITGTAASSATRHVVWQVIRCEQTPGTTGVMAGSAAVATGALTGTATTTGAVAGTAAVATGALTAAQRTDGVLAAVARPATGDASAAIVDPGATAGTSPNAVGNLTGTQVTPAVFGAQAPRAVGALLGQLVFPVITGEFAAVASAAVGGLTQVPDPPTDLPLRAGTPTLAATWRTGVPTMALGWRAGEPEI